MPHELPLSEMLLRLSLALGCGLVVGAERETHGRPAGLRTTVLVSVAACVAMLLSESLQYRYYIPTNFRADPARMSAGVLTGIGFLGAGSILRQENVIRGVTTAAMLWFVTVMGLAFGAGELVLGGIGFVVALIVLFVLTHVERHLQDDWYVTCTVLCGAQGPSEDQIRDYIHGLGIKVQRVELEYDVVKSQRTMRCYLKLKRQKAFDLAKQLVRHFSALPDVLDVKWLQ